MREASRPLFFKSGHHCKKTMIEAIPPDDSHLEHFKENMPHILHHVSAKNKTCHIIGDCNTNLLINTNISNFLNIASLFYLSYAFTILNG